eukprot:CAMPEP_0195333562 /NCGR_PEP_ID=MMETSP0708-20121125/14166_1 /TAXON_ID=33640 /ORGANISM="Asterionellopsis glacialis, Strain CCMP134" /LENGTH=249 /DNA_ID=CAMNT_0040402973 /DNA_START=28 /DNA_END=775 /DNA_ORIENTATION=-
MLEFVLERGNYWAIIGLMMIGLYISFAATNLIKRLVGLGLFQTSIILFYISLARIDGGTAPILFGKDYGKDKGHGDDHGAASDHAGEVSDHASGYDAVTPYASDGMANVYSNPLPHVLMLTAIVVGVATLAVGLAIIVRIREAYGTVEADEIQAMDLEVAISEAASEAEESKAARYDRVHFIAGAGQHRGARACASGCPANVVCPARGFAAKWYGRLAWLLSIVATAGALLMAIVLLDQVRSVEGGAVI